MNSPLTSPPLTASVAVSKLRYGMAIQRLSDGKCGCVVSVSADGGSGMAQFPYIGRQPVQATGVIEVIDDAEGWGWTQ